MPSQTNGVVTTIDAETMNRTATAIRDPMTTTVTIHKRREEERTAIVKAGKLHHSTEPHEMDATEAIVIASIREAEDVVK